MYYYILINLSIYLKSLHNLQIFEKERDYEWYGTDYTVPHYYYTIDDLFKEVFVSKDDKNQIIKRMIDAQKDEHLIITPNEDSEEVLDFTDLREFVWIPLFYWYELLPKTYVNPDRLQFSQRFLIEDYPVVYDQYKVTPDDSWRTELEKQRRENYTPVLDLNPDHYVAGGSKNIVAKYQYVYCVGHPDVDVEEEYLQQAIVIPSEPDIAEENH